MHAPPSLSWISTILLVAAAAHQKRCDAFLPRPSPCSMPHQQQQQLHRVLVADTVVGWNDRDRRRLPRPHAAFLTKMKASDDSEAAAAAQEQAKEALQSLGDFHQGSWKGKATSFTVTADVAAGILQTKTSPHYQLDVKLSYSQAAGRLALSEVCSWQDDDDLTFASSRSVSIPDSSLDVDAVDASYSLHTTHHTNNSMDDDGTNNSNGVDLPPGIIVGTSKAVQFAVEHCLAVSDDARVRLLALYGHKQELMRVVVCDEMRSAQHHDDESTAAAAASKEQSGMSAADLLEIQSDVDRIVDKIAGQVKGGKDDDTTQDSSTSMDHDPEDSMQRLQELKTSLTAGSAGSLSSQQSSSSSKDNDDRGPALVRHPISLLELTSGVWLGDAIIRDLPMVPGDNSKTGKGKGFGSSSSSSSSESTTEGPPPPPSFGSWVVGVQKVAREWLWDFGEQVRQNNDAGKAMGAEMETAMGQSMAGAVCENQSLSRRIPKEERMVYIDWNDGNGDNHVGFLMGSVSIQVPRFSTFGSRQTKPFYTELCVYQSAAPTDEGSSAGRNSIDQSVDDDTAVEELPEVICSRICRLYNSKGQLKQGSTSFYSLRRFGTEGEPQ